MTTIQKWTGRESRALREALRLSVREFARQLGVSDRAVTKWESGGVVPGPDSQGILDTKLRMASGEARERFELTLGTEPDGAGNRHAPTADLLTEDHGLETAAASDGGHPRQITHPVDGKIMALVDEGSFPSGPGNRPIWLSAFYMDVYPTTNRDYAAFIRATGHTPPSHWDDDGSPQGRDNHPVVNLTYRDAERYAEWAGKTLPSAAEWEKAARGPGGNVYPWGNQETPAKCNVRQTGVGSTTPVDRYHSGVSHYDVYDLAGNVWEWCRTETDPGRFVLKGSAFTSPLSMAAGAAMNDASETMLDDDTGFRCVSPLETIRELLRLP